MKRHALTQLLLTVVLALFFTGCASSTKQLQPSGFLGNYSDLTKGGKNEASYLYINHKANFTNYTKVNIDTVSLWLAENHELTDIEVAELEELSNYLHTALYNALKKDYEIVEYSGTDVMLLRVALTETLGAKQNLDTISTIFSTDHAIDPDETISSRNRAFVGDAAIEVEFLDSSNGTRLGAAVDENAGSKIDDAKWKKVEKTFNLWGEKMRDRLKRLTTASRLKQDLLDVTL